MDIIDLNHQKITESTFSFPEFVVAWKNQFIPSAHFWDTVNFRVLWPEWPHHFWPCPPKRFLLSIFVNLYQHIKNQFILSVQKPYNLIGWVHFGLYLRNKIFPKYRICWGTQQILKIYWTSSVKSNNKIFL